MDHRLAKDLSPERIAALTPLPHLRFCLGHDVHIAADRSLDRSELFGQRHTVGSADHEKINVAAGSIGTSRIGPKDLGGVHPGQPLKRVREQSLDADRLLHQGANLPKQGRPFVDGIDK